MASISSSGDLGKTERFLEAWTEAMGPDASLFYELGLALNRAGRLDEALHAYSRALELDPGLLEARYDRAEILLFLGRPEDAASDLEEALRLGATHWAVHLRLSEVAASRVQPEAFGRSVMLAFQEGAPPGVLLEMGDRWREWARDPILGEPLRRAILLYGKEDIWLQLSSD